MTTLRTYLEVTRGAASALARSLGVSPSTVTRWAASQVPAARVADVARATGIAAEQLRPDLAEAFGKGNR
jgi:DNA-binding transcriptional regulator YdaS (Cro superfamily)